MLAFSEEAHFKIANELVLLSLLLCRLFVFECAVAVVKRFIGLDTIPPAFCIIRCACCEELPELVLELDGGFRK